MEAAARRAKRDETRAFIAEFLAARGAAAAAGREAAAEEDRRIAAHWEAVRGAGGWIGCRKGASRVQAWRGALGDGVGGRGRGHTRVEGSRNSGAAGCKAGTSLSNSCQWKRW